MFASGSASSKTKSARFPGSSDPDSPSNPDVRAATAGHANDESFDAQRKWNATLFDAGWAAINAIITVNGLLWAAMSVRREILA